MSASARAWDCCGLRPLPEWPLTQFQHPVQWHEGIFRGGVLLAPMLSLERVSRELVNRILRPISSLMNIIAPTLAIVKVTENTMYPQLQEEFNIGGP